VASDPVREGSGLPSPLEALNAALAGAAGYVDDAGGTEVPRLLVAIASARQALQTAAGTVLAHAASPEPDALDARIAWQHELRGLVSTIATWARILGAVVTAGDEGRRRRAVEAIERNVTRLTEALANPPG
jgi:predicted TIM-barrel fold metal-dependent hydrolase